MQQQGERWEASEHTVLPGSTLPTTPLACRPALSPAPAWQFAGLNGKQPKSWVESQNLAALFQAPNSRNREVRRQGQGDSGGQGMETAGQATGLVWASSCHDCRPSSPHCPLPPSPAPPACPRAQEWARKWSGKTVRIRHPNSGKTMDVKVQGSRGRCLLRQPCPALLPRPAALPQAHLLPCPRPAPSPAPQIVDTCDDNDCDGCCTANANRHGGTLLDLEINTAERFWGSGGVRDVSALEWKVVG